MNKFKKNHNRPSSKLEKKEVNTCLMKNSDIKEVDVSHSFSLRKHFKMDFDNILND